MSAVYFEWPDSAADWGLRTWPDSVLKYSYLFDTALGGWHQVFFLDVGETGFDCSMIAHIPSKYLWKKDLSPFHGMVSACVCICHGWWLFYVLILYVILLGCKLQGAYPYFHDFLGQQPAIVMPAGDRPLVTTICCCFVRTTWNTMMWEHIMYNQCIMNHIPFLNVRKKNYTSPMSPSTKGMEGTRFLLLTWPERELWAPSKRDVVPSSLASVPLKPKCFIGW